MHSCFGFLCICAPRVPRMCLVCAMCVPCAYKVQKWQVWERLWATVWVQGTTSSHPKVLMNICSSHKSRSTLRLGTRLFLIVTECFGVFLGIFFCCLKFTLVFILVCVCACAHTQAYVYTACVPRHSCGCQRTTSRSWFFSTVAFRRLDLVASHLQQSF